MAEQTTPTHVATTATISARIPEGALILLGTFGDADAPQALLRLPGGGTRSVARGDYVSGDRVIAIEAGRMALDRNGTATWIAMPG